MPDTNQKAIFLDRDGTIIIEKSFISTPDDVELIPGSAQALAKLAKTGYALVIITNQSGVARGYFDEKAVQIVNARLVEMLCELGVEIAAIYYCPHYAQGIVPAYSIECPCRKPGTGMVEKAIKEFGIQPAFVIGDRSSDIELGINLHIPAILVKTGYGSKQPTEVMEMADFVAEDIAEATEWILDNKIND